MSREIEEHLSVCNKQWRISLIALSVQVEWVGIFPVFLLIPFPCEDAVVICTESDTSHFSKFHETVHLHAVSATHIVVSVYDVIVVGQASTENDAVYEDALFQFGQISDGRITA